MSAVLIGDRSKRCPSDVRTPQTRCFELWVALDAAFGVRAYIPHRKRERAFAERRDRAGGDDDDGPHAEPPFWPIRSRRVMYTVSTSVVTTNACWTRPAATSAAATASPSAPSAS